MNKESHGTILRCRSSVQAALIVTSASTASHQLCQVAATATIKGLILKGPDGHPAAALMANETFGSLPRSANR